MRIGLASYPFVNHDVDHNLAQMEAALRLAQGKVELLCFGEAFLQGFDALSWNYADDKQTALPVDSAPIRHAARLSLAYGVGLLFGYIERQEDRIYSSCAVMDGGALKHNYRRISRGWKDFRRTDGHYREGTETGAFWYRKRRLAVALCGDLWDFPERFRLGCPLIWPVYVNFSLQEWAENEADYARQAQLAAPQTLMVNSLSENPRSYGGAFYFAGGQVRRKLGYGIAGMMTIEV